MSLMCNFNVCGQFLDVIYGVRPPNRSPGTPSHIPTFISDLDLRVKVTQNIVQYPLHHVTYALATFEVAMSNGFGGNAFTRKYII